jgi:hypothetical protein
VVGYTAGRREDESGPRFFLRPARVGIGGSHLGLFCEGVSRVGRESCTLPSVNLPCPCCLYCSDRQVRPGQRMVLVPKRVSVIQLISYGTKLTIVD